MTEAKARGLLTVAMSGGDGGALARSAAVDYLLHCSERVHRRAFRKRTRQRGMRC